MNVSETKRRARRDASPIRLSACASNRIWGVRFICAPVRTPGTQQPVTGHQASSFRKWAYSRRFHPSRVRSVTIPGNESSQLHNCRIGDWVLSAMQGLRTSPGWARKIAHISLMPFLKRVVTRPRIPVVKHPPVPQNQPPELRGGGASGDQPPRSFLVRACGWPARVLEAESNRDMHIRNTWRAGGARRLFCACIHVRTRLHTSKRTGEIKPIVFSCYTVLFRETSVIRPMPRAPKRRGLFPGTFLYIFCVFLLRRF